MAFAATDSFCSLSTPCHQLTHSQHCVMCRLQRCKMVTLLTLCSPRTTKSRLSVWTGRQHISQLRDSSATPMWQALALKHAGYGLLSCHTASHVALYVPKHREWWLLFTMCGCCLLCYKNAPVWEVTTSAHWHVFFCICALTVQQCCSVCSAGRPQIGCWMHHGSAY